jgi:hypothetical protein
MEMDAALLEFKGCLKTSNATGLPPFVLEVRVGTGVVQDGHTHDSATFLKNVR